MKNNKKKGFTLMELLIVIAIIVVLVAIAIPVFGGQLTKAKETTDVANIRAAYAEAQTAILSGDKTAAQAATALGGGKDINGKDISLDDKSKLSKDGTTGIKYTATVLKASDGTKVFKWNFGDVSIS